MLEKISSESDIANLPRIGDTFLTKVCIFEGFICNEKTLLLRLFPRREAIHTQVDFDLVFLR